MTPLAHNLRACLPDLAARTHDQLLALFEDPAPDRCDLMHRALAEVMATVRRLGAEVERGEPPTV
jgi:hypothetical protein